MGRVEFQCQHCLTLLRMSDEYTGRMIRCPACRQTFVASGTIVQAAPEPRSGQQSARRSDTKRPARSESASALPASDGFRRTESGRGLPASAARGRQAEDPWDDDAEWDDSADDSTDDDPYSAMMPAAPKRRKSRLSPQWLRAFSSVCLMVFVFGMAGGLGYLAYEALSAGFPGNAVNLAWFPEKIDGFVYLEPAAILASPFVRTVEAKFPQIARRETDVLKPQDIDSVVAGFWKDSSPGSEIPGFVAFSPWLNRAGDGNTAVLIVVRLTRELDPGSLRLTRTTRYRDTNLYDDHSRVMAMPDAWTVLMGSEHAVKAALDRNGEEFRHSRFDFVELSGHVLVAGMGDSGSGTGLTGGSNSLTPDGNPISAPEIAGAFSEMFSRRTRGGCIGLTFGDDLHFSGMVQCVSPGDATDLVREMRRVVEQGKASLESLRNGGPLAMMAEPLTALMSTIAISEDAASITVSGKIGRSLIEAIPANGLPGIQ